MKDILIIIERVKELCGYKTDAALAKALGISPQNFNSQKKTGGIKDSLILHAVEKAGANPEWIRTGKGNKFQEENTSDDAETWKNKYIAAMEELNEARKEINRLTAPPSGAGASKASLRRGET